MQREWPAFGVEQQCVRETGATLGVEAKRLQKGTALPLQFLDQRQLMEAFKRYPLIRDQGHRQRVHLVEVLTLGVDQRGHHDHRFALQIGVTSLQGGRIGALGALPGLVLHVQRHVRHVLDQQPAPVGALLGAVELPDDNRHLVGHVVARREQHGQLAPPPLADLFLVGDPERLGHVQALVQGLALERHAGCRKLEVLLDHALRAPSLHRRIPAVKPGAVVEEVQYRSQAHPLARCIHGGGLAVRLPSRHCLARDPGEREVGPDLHVIGVVLNDGLADELAQARETRFRLEGLAGRMVHVPGARHALDDVLAMLGDVHLHATANAHASRTLRALVHPRQRRLQARVGRQQRDAPDEVLRCVHGNLLGVCGHDGAYTIS